ncbi:MAG: hypothetical protein E6Q97_11185 [Desulfurellales bacterium]|nr:MAG: hypothetical protein E6Q97_11185 [Desulfurellales bacterium]
MKKLIFLPIALSGCAAHVTAPPPLPVVRTIEVKTPVAVPCKPIEELGDEPSYPDTTPALQTAADIFARVKLLLQGRALRDARLRRYKAAKESC